MNRSEILIIRYRSTTVVSISQDQSPVVSTDTNNDPIEIDAQPKRKPRLTSLHRKKLAGWASHLINRLFSR